MERINTAAGYVRDRIGKQEPVVGIVLGSGLCKLSYKISDAVVIPYR